jgi:hypothetical protein
METLHPNPQGHQPPLNRNIGGIPLSEHLPPVTEGLLLRLVSIHKLSPFVMPDLIRHPEDPKRARFRLELIPMKIGAEMTPFMEAAPPLPSEGKD